MEEEESRPDLKEEAFSESEPHREDSRDTVKSKVVVVETAVPVRADKTPKKKEASSTLRKEKETTSAASKKTAEKTGRAETSETTGRRKLHPDQ